jgi:hypothetical protein
MNNIEVAKDLKGEQMNSETDKLNELKNEMMKRATDAKDIIGEYPPCLEPACLECPYHSGVDDEWGYYCKILKVRSLLTNIIALSEITPPQYVIVSKSERVFGPASKETCESMAKTLENVEVKKCD